MTQLIKHYELLTISFNSSLQHPSLPTNATNQAEDSGTSPASITQSPQAAGGQTSGGNPAPISNAGDQQLQTQTSTEDEPLPAGWEIRFDQIGRRYYVDHNTR